ncbi:MAG TPA: hypothetical protein HA224_00880 [Nanoarchaeota archaeon]|nr:hypothetical protein [Nanoarchaeota archaeon]
MVVVEVSLSSLFFFMLGFFTAVAIIIALMVVWVIFPKISEARKFFDFWLKVKNKQPEETK